VSLADALRVLAWVRWGASAELRRFPISPRQIDSWLTTLEIRSSHDESTAARQRAAELREHLSSLA
ncbi:MAG TPA: hypothetical protein VM328_09040, partial [Fimbriimonadaceae bacterium]|nr:hypothetical protein [Fimbriimonadaceae bacterium]